MPTSPKILYKLPSRERPLKLFACLDNITSLARHDNYEILLTLDLNDKTCTSDEFKERLSQYDKVTAIYGHSGSKIAACNRDLWMTSGWDILCLHSDDMEFTVEGFDLRIIAAFEGWRGLVHFPDQVAKEKLITYAMMHREYFERTHYVYNPQFFSVYPDNDQHDMAVRLNQYKFVNENILLHKHAMWGYGPPDALLLKTEDPIVYERDKKTYLERQAFFGLTA